MSNDFQCAPILAYPSVVCGVSVDENSFSKLGDDYIAGINPRNAPSRYYGIDSTTRQFVGFAAYDNQSLPGNIMPGPIADETGRIVGMTELLPDSNGYRHMHAFSEGDTNQMINYLQNHIVPTVQEKLDAKP